MSLISSVLFFVYKHLLICYVLIGSTCLEMCVGLQHLNCNQNCKTFKISNKSIIVYLARLNACPLCFSPDNL